MSETTNAANDAPIRTTTTHRNSPDTHHLDLSAVAEGHRVGVTCRDPEEYLGVDRLAMNDRGRVVGTVTRTRGGYGDRGATDVWIDVETVRGHVTLHVYPRRGKVERVGDEGGTSTLINAGLTFEGDVRPEPRTVDTEGTESAVTRRSRDDNAAGPLGVSVDASSGVRPPASIVALVADEPCLADRLVTGRYDATGGEYVDVFTHSLSASAAPDGWEVGYITDTPESADVPGRYCVKVRLVPSDD